MRRGISVWLLLGAGVLLYGIEGAWAQQTSSGSEMLDGREVAVRVFREWDKDRWNYQIVRIPLAGNMLRFDVSGVGFASTAVGVLVRADQIDEVVKGAVDWDATLLKHGSEIKLYSRSRTRSKCMRFIDGASNGIAFCTGEVYKRGAKPEEDELKARFVLDEQGKTRWRNTTTKYSKYYVRVRHPYYGEWTYGIPLNQSDYTWRLPIVRPGTVQYERSIRGTMVDDANEPVVGVSIRVERVYPPGGKVVYVIGSARTDEYGYFHLYPLMWPESRAAVGDLIPAGSCYETWIQPPVELGIVSGTLCIPNDKEHTINLIHGQFHTFAFDDGDERMTKTNEISNFRLHVDRQGKNTLTYKHRKFKNGLVLPEGTYRIADWGLKYQFDPIEVAKDSPKELVFRTKFKSSDVIRYSGSVVDGVTGDLIEGAFVVGVDNGMSPNLGANFSEFTSEQWDKLRTLEESFSVDRKLADRMGGLPYSREDLSMLGDVNEFPVLEDAILPVHRLWDVIKGVRTDSEGRFEIEFSKSEEFARLIFFEEGYLSIMLRKYDVMDDGDGHVDIGPMPLFPAAKVIVDVNVVGGRQRIIPQWIIDMNDCPQWVYPQMPKDLGDIKSIEELLAIEEKLRQDSTLGRGRIRALAEFSYGRWANFGYSQDISHGKKKVVHVPANVKLKLKIQPLMDSKHEWIPYTYPQEILLKEGETMDLGVCEIRKSIHVYVKIVDEQGKPVEGIPVDNPIDGPPDKHSWAPSKGRHNSDANGWVRFNVYQDMTGKFTITCERHNLQESLAFKVGGEEDAGREFVFPISEEFRKQMMGE